MVRRPLRRRLQGIVSSPLRSRLPRKSMQPTKETTKEELGAHYGGDYQGRVDSPLRRRLSRKKKKI